MTIARDFSRDVVTELREIKQAIRGQETRVNDISERIEVMARRLDDHLASEVAARSRSK